MRVECEAGRGGGFVVYSRGEKAAVACKDCDGDVVACGDLVQQDRDSIIVVLGESIELLGEVEGDYRDGAAGAEGYCLLDFGLRHDG